MRSARNDVRRSKSTLKVSGKRVAEGAEESSDLRNAYINTPRSFGSFALQMDSKESCSPV